GSAAGAVGAGEGAARRGRWRGASGGGAAGAEMAALVAQAVGCCSPYYAGADAGALLASAPGGDEWTGGGGDRDTGRVDDDGGADRWGNGTAQRCLAADIPAAGRCPGHRGSARWRGLLRRATRSRPP